MGKSFEVAVYQTAKLGDQLESNYGERYKASSAMKTFIEGAFDHSGNQHTITVDTPQVDVSAPVQDVNTSFGVSAPCESVCKSYDNLVYWWQDYVDCNLSWRNDGMLLLTAEDGGAGWNWQNFYAVAEGGPDVAKLDGGGYGEFGCGQSWEDMQNVLHELGHGFLTCSNEHDRGNVFKHDCGWLCSNYYRTPMGHGGDAGTNACGNDIPSDHDDKCNAMYYAPDCSTDHFEHTSNHE